MMNIYLTPPEYEFHMKRAHEMRSEVWRNIFARIAGVPVYLAGWLFNKVRRAIKDNRVAP